MTLCDVAPKEAMLALDAVLWPCSAGEFSCPNFAASQETTTLQPLGLCRGYALYL